MSTTVTAFCARCGMEMDWATGSVFDGKSFYHNACAPDYKPDPVPLSTEVIAPNTVAERRGNRADPKSTPVGSASSQDWATVSDEVAAMCERLIAGIPFGSGRGDALCREAAAQIATLERDLADALGDATVLRSYCEMYHETPSMTRSRAEHLEPALAAVKAENAELLSRLHKTAHEAVRKTRALGVEKYHAETALAAAESSASQLREALTFVETWVCNPASAYSTDALEGLFAMTRDRIAALQQERKT